MSRSPEDRWCPVEIAVLATGEGVACGRFASCERQYEGSTVWVCPRCNDLLDSISEEDRYL